MCPIFYFLSATSIPAINKNDGKTPQEWLRIYSQTIEVAGSNGITRSSTSWWLWSPLSPHGWKPLSLTPLTPRAPSDKSSSTTFKGAVTRAGTRDDSQCKQGKMSGNTILDPATVSAFIPSAGAVSRSVLFFVLFGCILLYFNFFTRRIPILHCERYRWIDIKCTEA